VLAAADFAESREKGKEFNSDLGTVDFKNSGTRISVVDAELPSVISTELSECFPAIVRNYIKVRNTCI